MNNSKIKVSVLMLTYNQEKYIDEALKSVTKQITNFNYEIVIGDDCSTDRTLQILQKWKALYPEIIHILSSETNQGLLPNFIRTFNSCKGEYIAICEGDDYWIDRHKLQIQVDFLDSHQDYSTSIHRVLNYYEDDNSKSLSNGSQKTDNSIIDLARMNFITNVSAMFRATRVNNLPEWFGKVGTYDYALHMLNAETGKIYYHNRTMAVYRKHLGAIWSRNGKDKQLLLSMQVREQLLNYFKNKNNQVYSEILNAYLACAYALINVYISEGQDSNAGKIKGLIKQYKPEISDSEIEKIYSNTTSKNRSAKQSILTIAKTLRRYISKLIPVPHP